MKEDSLDGVKSQMRKGLLEFCILLVISGGKIYASDILKKLTSANLLVVEGTLYPLLSRLRSQGLVEYEWEESRSGPPRKYYTLTKRGRASLDQLTESWEELRHSITSLTK
jgi:PadR family transcriptional regulator PadR